MLDVVPCLLDSNDHGKLRPHNDRAALTKPATAFVKTVFERFTVVQLAALASVRTSTDSIPLLCMHLGSHPVLKRVLEQLTGELDVYTMNEKPLYAACLFDPDSRFSRWMMNIGKEQRLNVDEAMQGWGARVGLWESDEIVTPITTMLKLGTPEHDRYLRRQKRAQSTNGKAVMKQFWAGHTNADDPDCECSACAFGMCDARGPHADDCDCPICATHADDCDCRSCGPHADDCDCRSCKVGGGRGEPSSSAQHVKSKAARAAAPRTRRDMKAHQNTCRVRLSLSQLTLAADTRLNSFRSASLSSHPYTHSPLSMMQGCLGTFVTVKKNHTQPGGRKKDQPSRCDRKRDKAVRDFDCVLPLSLQQNKQYTEALRRAHAASSLTNKEARIEALKAIGICEVLEDDDDDDETAEPLDAWVQCSECEAWRVLSPSLDDSALKVIAADDAWMCATATWGAFTCANAAAETSHFSGRRLGLRSRTQLQLRWLLPTATFHRSSAIAPCCSCRCSCGRRKRRRSRGGVPTAS